MKIQQLAISGCYLIQLPHFKDKRGEFVKTFNTEALQGTPLESFELKEEFYSSSEKNVLRGLHFQTPPADHNKLVYCIQGEVLDFFLDVRKESPTFGQHLSISLASNNPQLLYLPKGLAHGFLTLTENATLVYKTDHVYTPECDDGILWSSIGLDLPDVDYIVSERDKAFVTFQDFRSPF